MPGETAPRLISSANILYIGPGHLVSKPAYEPRFGQILVPILFGVLCQKVGTPHPAAVPLLAAVGVRERSLCGGMLRCFRCLEASEQQPEGKQDDLERSDGKDKDVPP
jgi:hypothetical protein